MALKPTHNAVCIFVIAPVARLTVDSVSLIA